MLTPMLAPLSYFEANDVFFTVSAAAAELLVAEESPDGFPLCCGSAHLFWPLFLFPSGLPSSPHRGVFPLSSTFHRVLGINASFSQTSHSSSGTPEAIPSLEHFPDPQMKLAAPVRAHGTGVPAYNNYF